MKYTTVSPKNTLENIDRIPIRRANGTVIGEVFGEIFIKKVEGSLHMLRVPPAWAVDTVAITQAKQAGAKVIEIHDQESGEKYCSSIASFEQYGFAFNRGFGNQIALSLNKWGIAGQPVQMTLI